MPFAPSRAAAGAPALLPAPAVLLAAGAVAAGLFSGWHVGLNDFWGNAILADYLGPRRPSTWYSGFFPFGYLVLLRAAGEARIAVAYAVNVAAGAALVLLVTRMCARWAAPTVAAAIGLLLASWPAFFQYVTTPGPDLPAAAAAAGGVALLAWSLAGPASRSRLVLAGALLGLGTLLRYHIVIVALAAPVAWLLVVERGRRSLLPLAGPAVALALQTAVNVSAGRGPFETSQAFNVHRAMHGLDWTALTSATPVPSWSEVVSSDPGSFARVYARALLGLAAYAAPALLALVVAPRGTAAGRAARLLALVTTVYIFGVSAGASSRASLPLLPLAALSAAIAMGALTPRARRWPHRAVRAAAFVAMLVVMLTLARHAVMDLRMVQRRAAAQRDLSAVEAALRREGVTHPRQAFTNDLSLYLPGMPPHVPYANGGWYRVDSPSYDRDYPPICVHTPECFLLDARRRGVTAVVLRPDAPGAPTRSAGLVRVDGPPGWSIYRVAAD